MEEQRQLTVAKTQRKVQLLKAQFVEHKNKWEAVSAFDVVVVVLEARFVEGVSPSGLW